MIVLLVSAFALSPADGATVLDAGAAAKKKCKSKKAAEAKKKLCKKPKPLTPALPAPAAAAFSINPASYEFPALFSTGNGPSHAFTVTNTGTAASGNLDVVVATTSGTGGTFVKDAGSTCLNSLLPGSTCSVSVHVNAAATGVIGGAVTVTDPVSHAAASAALHEEIILI